MFSCGTDKQSQLTKLKEQQTQISDKIKNIEDQLKNATKEGPNPDEFKFIGITEVKKNHSTISSEYRVNLTVIRMLQYLRKLPEL